MPIVSSAGFRCRRNGKEGVRLSRAYYNDSDKYVCAWLGNLQNDGAIPAGDIDCRSISDVEAKDLDGYDQCHFFAGIGGWPLALRLAGWPDTLPVWTGSPPCQPFSLMGKRCGTADKRHQWPQWFRLIEQCRPSTIFGEQVASARLWIDHAFADLEAIGYACGAADLPAACVGSPQNRARLWFVADASGERRRAGLRKALAQQDGAQLADANRWPTEPEVSRVAHGIPGSVDFNRAFGNAIVPAVATEFILSAVEALSN